MKKFFLFILFALVTSPLFASFSNHSAQVNFGDYLFVLNGEIYPNPWGTDLFEMGSVEVYAPEDAMEIFGEDGKNGVICVATKEFVATHTTDEINSINGVANLSVWDKTKSILHVIYNHFWYLGFPFVLLLLEVILLLVGYNRRKPNYDLSQTSFSVSRRFVGYVIDNFLTFIPVAIYCYFVLSDWPYIAHPHYMSKLYVVFVYYLFRLSYYLLCELFFARTLGKLICGTKVVADSSVNWTRAIAIRTLGRLIPFDEISFIFYTPSSDKPQMLWHDTLSKTMVVSKKKAHNEKKRISIPVKSPSVGKGE